MELSQWFRAGRTSPWAGTSRDRGGFRDTQNIQTVKPPFPYWHAATFECLVWAPNRFVSNLVNSFIRTCFCTLFSSAYVTEVPKKKKQTKNQTGDLTECFDITFNQTVVQQTMRKHQMITKCCFWFLALEALCWLTTNKVNKLLNKRGSLCLYSLRLQTHTQKNKQFNDTLECLIIEFISFGSSPPLTRQMHSFHKYHWWGIKQQKEKKEHSIRKRNSRFLSTRLFLLLRL